MVTSERPSRRHGATRQEILNAAWTLARKHGLTGWSLRDLAAAVGMQAPSLYVYFDGKDSIYDAMFHDGYQQMLDQTQSWAAQNLPAVTLVRDAAHRYVEFATTDPARMQLLFQRAIPSFIPSAESYALAQQVVHTLNDVLAAAGISHPAAGDLWTALFTGIASQQTSNEPGGDRWTRLVDDAVDMFLAHFAPAHMPPQPS